MGWWIALAAVIIIIIIASLAGAIELKEQEVYDQGWQAAKNGLEASDNPMKGKNFGKEWLEGYLAYWEEYGETTDDE